MELVGIFSTCKVNKHEKFDTSFNVSFDHLQAEHHCGRDKGIM